MQIRGTGLAHVGRKRDNNEDCWLADDQLGLYAVADGVGGHLGGEVAARTAIEAAAGVVRARRDLLEEVVDGTARSKELEGLIRQAFGEANQAVRDKAAPGSGEHGMGCTLTLLLVVRDRGVMGHVGDSRLYVCRDGRVHQLSRDQTLAAELAREGVIEQKNVKKHQYANVLTQAMGRPHVRPEVLRFEVLPGDRALLCSDGLSNYVDDADWLARQLAEEDLEGIPEELVRFANEAGGGDNITALVVAVEPEPDEKMRAAAEVIRAKLSALEGSFLCSDLSLARQSLVVSHCELREHADGGVVIAEEAAIPGLVLLVDGALEVWRGKNRMGRLRPGEHFGALALVRDRSARAKVIAREPSRTLTMTSDGLRALTRIRPRLGAILLRRLACELGAALEERLEDDALVPPHLAP